MKNSQLIFLHEHNVRFIYAHKQNDYYEINEYHFNKAGETFNLEDEQDYFYMSCSKCNSLLYPKNSKSKSFFINQSNLVFFQLKSESPEDNNIYIGTDEEKKNHFYSIMMAYKSKIKEYKTQTFNLEKSIQQ